jgi:cytidine deaminase
MVKPPPASRKTPADKSQFSGSITFPRKHGEMEVHWSVQDFRVRIEPENGYAKLNEPERVTVFNRILAKVRTRSDHPDGIYSAALAITQNGQMFVASNAQRQHEFHKDCAEINTINAITQLVGSQEKIARLYLMIGFNTPTKDTPPEQLERPFAPCGKCMDTLHSCSTPEAMITMLPTNDGTLPLSLNLTAHHVEELKAGEAWQTRISNLMIDKDITLSDKEKEYAHAGWQALTKEPTPHRALTEREVNRLFVAKRKLTPQETELKALIIQTVSNAGTRRESEAALDIDHSPAGINHFMVQRIQDAYRKRSPIEGKPGEHAVNSIRCVVLRLADGTFHTATEVEGPEENAVPHAGVTAVAATRHLHQPITDAWVMRVSKKDIDEGKLYTSPKEELERLYKRRSQHENDADIKGHPVNSSINIHYISFNNGTLKSREVEEITHHYFIEDIFTSRFKGSRHYGHNGNANGGENAARSH